ncbi:MAG TPA: UrcA family protein [Alphaproteobacteria bacterium]|jgi:UrcA family protein|nr:UrcA family protein [Alphaproteobacteria bacterium]
MLALATRTLAFTASALLVTAAAGFASPARAADADSRTALVHYQDLDLSTGAGEAKLKARIAKTAETVCGPQGGRTLADRERFDSCRNTAIASASTQMDAVIASVRSSDHRYAMNHDAIAMLGR